MWVNNAGVGIRDSVADMEMSACRELFETNFFGAVACLQAVVPPMRKAGGGTIINISSVAGHIPVPFMAPYSATQVCPECHRQRRAAGIEARQHQCADSLPGLRANRIRRTHGGGQKGNVRPQVGARDHRRTGGAGDLRGYRKRKREVIVPWTMIPVVKLYQLFPGLVEWGMGKAMK